MNTFMVPKASVLLNNRDEFLTSLDRIFDKMLETNFPEFSKEIGLDFFEKGSYPKVDITEYSDRIIIEAEIPGLEKSEVNVKVEEGVLNIMGNKKPELYELYPNGETDTGKVLKREIKRSSFKRSWTLGNNIDSKNISAKFEQGMLYINIPKLKKVESNIFNVNIE